MYYSSVYRVHMNLLRRVVRPRTRHLTRHRSRGEFRVSTVGKGLSTRLDATTAEPSET